VNGRERYFKTINFTKELMQGLHGQVVVGRTFFAGGSWGADSNSGVATSSFFSSFCTLQLFTVYSNW